MNGVNKTVLDGPEVEIAANISITLQTEDMKADLSRLEVTGGEADKISACIKTDVTIEQVENRLEMIILNALFQFMEDIRVQAGTCVEVGAEESVAIKAGTDMTISGRTSRLSGENAVTISSGGALRFSDGKHSITLAEIIERLGE